MKAQGYRSAAARVALALLVLAVGLLAACGGAEQAAEVAPLTEAGAATVSGMVTYLDRSALPPNAIVNVELVQMAPGGGVATVISSQTIETGGQQQPFPFAVAYDPAQIDPTQTYLVGARITVDGQLTYASQTATAVITNGAPTSGIEIIVSPWVEPAAGTLTGVVTYLERMALDPAAIIVVDLQNVSSGTPAIVTTTEVPAEGRQVPIPFELAYDPAPIDPAGTYLLYARILVNGATTFASATGAPVLTNGAPAGNVELVVSPVAAAPTGGVIQGTVTTSRAPEALEPGALLQVELREPMLADAPATAQVEIPLDGLNFPVSFALPYDPAAIAADRGYVVAARVISGNQLLYTTLSPVPVLTNGAPASNIIVPVAVVPDPAGGVLRFTATGDPTAAPATWPAGSNAYLNVEIREPMLADAAAVAYTYVPLAGLTLPVAWELGYDVAAIDPNKDYVLDARVIDNNQLTFSATPVPVLTKGAPANDVTIALNPQGTGGGDAVVSGQLTAEGAPALDPAATIQVEIREPMLADAPAFVTISFAAEGRQFPIPFEIPYQSAQIDPNKAYIVDARIIGGNQLLYSAAAGVPVITQGAPTTGVNVPMVPGPTDAPPGGTITGNITTDVPAPLDPAAVWYIDLREAGTTGAPLVTISSATAGQQFAIPFEVPYNPAQIDPNKEYVLGARILLGDRVLYASAVGVPVITKGAPVSNVTVNIPPQ